MFSHKEKKTTKDSQKTIVVPPLHFNNKDINKRFLSPPPYSSNWQSIYFPPKNLNIKEFAANGKLIPEEYIDPIMEYRQKDKNQNSSKKKFYYTKDELNSALQINIKYDLIFSPQNNSKYENMSAVYPTECGSGAFGEIRQCQVIVGKKPITDTDFFVAKIMKPLNELPHHGIDNADKQKHEAAEKKGIKKRTTNKSKKQKKQLFKKQNKPLQRSPLIKPSTTINSIAGPKNPFNKRSSSLTPNNIQAAVLELNKQSEKNKLSVVDESDLKSLEQNAITSIKVIPGPPNDFSHINIGINNEYKILTTVYANQKNEIFHFEQKIPGKKMVEMILMPWIVDSIDLEALIKRHKKENKLFSLEQGLFYCLEALQSCHELHEKHKVLHLDLKPENIMVNEETGEMKIIDFGISEIGKKGDHSTLQFVEKIELQNVRGTPTYTDLYFIPFMFAIDPEQVASAIIDFSSKELKHLFCNQDFLISFVKFLIAPIINHTAPAPEISNFITYTSTLMNKNLEVAYQLATAIMTAIRDKSFLTEHLSKVGHAAFLGKNTVKEKAPPTEAILESNRKEPDQYIIYTKEKEYSSIAKILKFIMCNTKNESEENHFHSLMEKIINRLMNFDIKKRGTLEEAIQDCQGIIDSYLLKNPKSPLFNKKNARKEMLDVDCKKFLAFTKKEAPHYASLINKQITLSYEYQSLSFGTLDEIRRKFTEHGISVTNHIRVKTSNSLYILPSEERSPTKKPKKIYRNSQKKIQPDKFIHPKNDVIEGDLPINDSKNSKQDSLEENNFRIKDKMKDNRGSSDSSSQNAKNDLKPATRARRDSKLIEIENPDKRTKDLSRAASSKNSPSTITGDVQMIAEDQTGTPPDKRRKYYKNRLDFRYPQKNPMNSSTYTSTNTSKEKLTAQDSHSSENLKLTDSTKGLPDSSSNDNSTPVVNSVANNANSHREAYVPSDESREFVSPKGNKTPTPQLSPRTSPLGSTGFFKNKNEAHNTIKKFKKNTSKSPVGSFFPPYETQPEATLGNTITNTATNPTPNNIANK